MQSGAFGVSASPTCGTFHYRSALRLMKALLRALARLCAETATCRRGTVQACEARSVTSRGCQRRLKI
jgi:hypothetical protein